MKRKRNFVHWKNNKKERKEKKKWFTWCELDPSFVQLRLVFDVKYSINIYFKTSKQSLWEPMKALPCILCLLDPLIAYYHKGSILVWVIGICNSYLSKSRHTLKICTFGWFWFHGLIFQHNSNLAKFHKRYKNHHWLLECRHAIKTWWKKAKTFFDANST